VYFSTNNLKKNSSLYEKMLYLCAFKKWQNFDEKFCCVVYFTLYVIFMYYILFFIICIRHIDIQRYIEKILFY